MFLKRRNPLSRNVVCPGLVNSIDISQENPDELDTSHLIVLADLAIRAWLMRQHEDAVKCFTCDFVSGWNYMEVGHLIKRTIYLLRWDIRNVKPQCPKCNHDGGHTEMYAAALEELQPGLPADLLLLSHQPFRLTNEFILTQIQLLK